MKKLVSALLALSLMVTGVFAAAVPEFLTKQYTNYTADYSISMSFDNSDEVADLLGELEIPETVNNFVDLKALLKSLFTQEGKMSLQADMSSDYEKIKIGITSENQQSIDINKNLNVAYNMKLGMWMNMDLSDANAPVFDIIYSHPMMNKYLKISAAEVLDEQTVMLFKTIFNKEVIESISEKGMELFSKYATIKTAGTRCTITMDNDGFTAYFDEVMAFAMEMMMPAELEYNPYEEFPSIKGWQVLGKDGIKMVYSLKGKNIAATDITTDISVDIAQIYNTLMGEEWPFEAAGRLDFTVKESAKISRVGTTKVSFPVLNDSNTILLEDLMPDYSTGYEDYEEYEPAPEYPVGYVGGRAEWVPIVDGEMYMPLRAVLEKAYEDSVSLSYDNGVITAESEYFPGFDKLVVTAGSDKVYAGDTEYTVGAVIVENGTTYVNRNFFCEVFGWRLSSATYNFTNGIFSYNYITY